MRAYARRAVTVLLARKNAVYPREVSAIVHTRDTNVARSKPAPGRSIDRSIDRWKREYAPVRFLLIECQLLELLPTRGHVRTISSKISITEKCAEDARKLVPHKSLSESIPDSNFNRLDFLLFAILELQTNTNERLR